MKNKELLIHRTEQLENGLKVLKFMITRETPTQKFLKKIKDVEEILQDLQTLIERE